MTSPTRPRTQRLYHAARGPSLPATSALLLVLAAMATLIALGQLAVLLGASELAALAAGQLGMLALALGVARAARLPLRALGIARAPGRLVAAGALIGASAWYLNLALVDALVTVERAEVRTLERLVERPALPAVMLAVALAPAICEEVVFRGALLRALAARSQPAAAVAASAAVFAIYHLKPVQLLPTFLLGLALGALALRAGSILPSAVAHCLNNAMAIVVHRGADEPLARGLAAHPRLALAGFGALFVAGAACAVTAPAPGSAPDLAPAPPGAPPGAPPP